MQPLSDEAKEALLQHVAASYGPIDGEITMPTPVGPVTLLHVPPTPDVPFHALVTAGMSAAPMNAFQTLLGIETLSLRMERHVENAKKVAEFLKGHDAVEYVSYAGLSDSPYARRAKKYTPKGAGALFTFGVKGGYDACVKLVENVEIFSHLANLGDARSLVIHSASTTHRQLTDEQRVAAGAGPEVVRISIGIETAEDLIADLDQALAKATPKTKKKKKKSKK